MRSGIWIVSGYPKPRAQFDAEMIRGLPSVAFEKNYAGRDVGLFGIDSQSPPHQR
jgi:hypothetical protein